MRIVGYLVAALLLSCWTPDRAAAQSTAWMLASIDVEEAKRLSAAQVVALSGLKTGETTTVVEMNAAMNRLASTGLFREVSYRYTVDNGRIAMTIAAHEPVWEMAVVVDNFIWYSPAEIRTALAAAIPTFDGRIPLTDGANALVTAALEDLLRARGIQAKVTLQVAMSQDGSNRRLRFTHDLPLTLCALTFAGVDAADSAELSKAVGHLTARPFSSDVLTGALAGNGVPALRQRGLLQAEFDVATSHQPMSTACPSGVNVAVAVRNTARYRWAGARWQGATVITPKALDAEVGLKVGDVADEVKVQVGLEKIKASYGKKGYLDLKIVRAFAFNGEQAALNVTIDEGKAFTMGQLTATGVGEADGKRLMSQWPLKAGAPFDPGAAQEFMRRVAAAFKLPPGLRPTVATERDAATNKVNVTVGLK